MTLKSKKKTTKKAVKKKAVKKIKHSEWPVLEWKARVNYKPNQHLAHIGMPTTGMVRFEWMMAIQSMIIPVCYGVRTTGRKINFISPIGFHVAEARNLIVKDFIVDGTSEWLLFIDHDVLPNAFTHGYMLEHMQEKKYPIVSGLYFAKGTPSFPLVFRGRGKGPYTNWKMGDKVEVDGVPMGLTIIHRSLLEYFWKKSPEIQTSSGEITKEVFVSPRTCYQDPESAMSGTLIGTEDLYFCDEILKNDNEVLAKTGWKHLKNKEYPFLIDTRLFCKHIDEQGRQWPLGL